MHSLVAIISSKVTTWQIKKQIRSFTLERMLKKRILATWSLTNLFWAGNLNFRVPLYTTQF